MISTSFEAFRQQVLQDTTLQARLRDIADRRLFITMVVALGLECGYQFTAEDVTQAMHANRRAWQERWI